MPKFTCNAGHDWAVNVTASTIRNVKAATGINLCDAIDGSLFAKLSDDPGTLADVLFVVCKQQATERGITDERFGESLAGDAIEKASSALIEAIILFFPKRQGEPLAVLAGKIEKMKVMILAKAMATYSDPDLERKLQAALIFGASSTSSPELPELTPIDSRFAK